MTGQFLVFLLLALVLREHCYNFADHSWLNLPQCSTVASLQNSSLKKRYFPEVSSQNNLKICGPIVLLLLLSGDIQLNPGPRPLKYPCGICSKACKWTTPCVRCDSCLIYYHQHCMTMPDGIFQVLHNVSWECFRCGVPNFSSSLFNSSSSISSNSSNRFDAISPDNCPQNFVFDNPGMTSSPLGHSNPPIVNTHSKKSLKVLVLNCRNIDGKKPLLDTLVDSVGGDVIIGTESWLDSSINSNDVFPSGFTAYRKDRNEVEKGEGCLF